MHALIHRVPGGSRLASLDIAGRPLVIRQVQWLRTIGCDRIAIELEAGPDGDALASLVEADEAIGYDVALVTSSAPMTLEQLAARAGVPLRGALVIPANVIGDGDLARLYARAGDDGVVAHVPGFPELPWWTRGAAIRLLGDDGRAQRHVVGPGAAICVDGPRDAMALALTVLAGHLPAPRGDRAFVPPVHAAERSPSVWVARGAIVSPDARLTGPCFIGCDAVVAADAVVGPGAIVGERAVVESGTRVRSSYIDPHVIVGEGLDIEAMRVSESGIVDLRSDTGVALDDPLLVASRRVGSRPALASRLVAFIAVLSLTPLALSLALLGVRGSELHALLDALLKVGLGRLSLVGVRPLPSHEVGTAPLAQDAARAAVGAIDVERALVADGAGPEDRLRARAWYAASKSLSVDLTLLHRMLAA